MVSTSSAFKKFIVFILIISINLIPLNAYALITVNDWSVSNVTKQGDSAKISATRTKIINGSSVVQRSSALFSPSSAQLAKSLGKGIGAAALAIAVAQLIGQGVEWVLDPANNQIKYKEKTGPSYFRVFSGTWKDFTTYGEAYTFASSKCTTDFTLKSDFKLVASDASTNVYDQQWSCVTPSDAGNTIRKLQAKTQTEERTLSLNEVATRIKSNAASGDATSQQAVADSADDTITNDPSARQEVQNQLERNAKSDTQEEAEPDPSDPDSKNQGVKLPKFCSWAPVVCEAAQATLDYFNLVKDWYHTALAAFTRNWDYAVKQYEQVREEIKDYLNDEPEPEDTELEFKDPENSVSVNIDFGGSCPLPRSVPVSFASISTSITFSFDSICTVANVLRPVVIALASFTAALIIAGVRTDD